MASQGICSHQNSDGKSHNNTNTTKRLAICYPCALRMSTIPLPAVCGATAASFFHKGTLTAPPTPAAVEKLVVEQRKASSSCPSTSTSSSSSSSSVPLPFTAVTTHHPIFDIIYESNAFYQARVEEEVAAAKRNAATDRLIKPIGADGKHADISSTQQIDLPAAMAKAIESYEAKKNENENNNASYHYHHPTCVACRGLYQFLDGYYMPRAVEEVRRSPYLDSEEISVNVSVPRGFSFLWLSAAAEYLRGAMAVNKLTVEMAAVKRAANADAVALSSASTAAVVSSTAPTTARAPAFPEDYSSFKDMYTPDVRARMMARLNKAEEEEAHAVGGKRPREEADAEGSEEEKKRLGTNDNDVNAMIRPRCSQKFTYSLSGTQGVIVDLLAQNIIADALTGENTDGMGFSANGYAIQLSSRQQFEVRRDRTAAVVPKEWCTSKGAASGEPLQLFILDDFVIPYLKASDEGFFKGRNLTTVKDLNTLLPAANTSQPTSDAAESSPLAGYSAHVVEAVQNPQLWTCLTERGEQWVTRIAAESSFFFSTPSSGDDSDNAAGAAPQALLLPTPLQCTVRHASVYIIGKYCKYMRGMSQSPWFHDGARIGAFPLSLQEYLANPILPLFFPYGIPQPVAPPGTVAAKATAAAALYEKEAGLNSAGGANTTDQQQQSDKGLTVKTDLGSATQIIDPNLMAMFHVLGYGNYKFHTAGREDVDVRMLGTGRPFVLEVISPHKEKIDFEAAKRAVASFYGGAELITIEDLAYTTAEITVIMSKHASDKQKVYRAVCYSSRAILSDDDPLLVAANNVKDLVAQQSTPIRVLHRRSLLTRPKTIHSLKISRINPHWLIVDLETQAGTYIKEFVHGDMGRTVPNLGTLLDSRTDIIQLDVLGMSSMDVAGGGGSAAAAALDEGEDGDE